MDHATYLEHHHEITNTGLTTLAMLMARGDTEEAAAALIALRAQAAALWEQRRDEAGRSMNP